MKITRAMELIKQYGVCPRCGSDKITGTKGSLIVKNKSFYRSCECGYNVEIKETADDKTFEKIFKA